LSNWEVVSAWAWDLGGRVLESFFLCYKRLLGVLGWWIVSVVLSWPWGLLCVNFSLSFRLGLKGSVGV